MNARALVSFALPLLLLPALTTLAKDRGPQEMLALRPGVPVVVDPIEPLPVRKAAEDLRRDLAKVFGETSPLRTQAPAAEEEIAIIISSRGNEASIAGPESHAMIVRDGHVTGVRNTAQPSRPSTASSMMPTGASGLLISKTFPVSTSFTISESPAHPGTC